MVEVQRVIAGWTIDVDKRYGHGGTRTTVTCIGGFRFRDFRGYTTAERTTDEGLPNHTKQLGMDSQFHNVMYIGWSSTNLSCFLCGKQISVVCW